MSAAHFDAALQELRECEVPHTQDGVVQMLRVHKKMNCQAMLRVVEKKRAYEDIVQQVIALIEEGKLKRGDQLPPERALTEIFKVSRTTVRKAIHTMESMKLLQCRQGIGTYVLASSEDDLIQPLAAAHLIRKMTFATSSNSEKLLTPIAQLTHQQNP